MWQLNCDLVVKPDGSILLLGRQAFSLDRKAATILPLLKQLTSGVTDEEWQQWLAHAIVGPFLRRLESLKLLHKHDSRYDGKPLERSAAFLQRLSPEPGQAIHKLANLRIAILGCGGVGANVAYHLSASGVQHFFLLDSDVVEASNLNRQYPFTPADLGHSKVSALARHIYGIAPQAKIQQRQQRLQSSEDFANCLVEPYDLIVCAIDEPPILIKQWLTQFALEHPTLLVFGGAGYDTVNIGPLLTTRTAKQAYLLTLEKQLTMIDPALSKPLIGSLPSINSLMTSYLSNQIVAHFSGVAPCNIVNHELIVNPWDLSILSRVNYE